MKKFCTLCGKREAVLHYRESINGKEKELYLCSECAKEKGIYSPSLFFAEELGTFSPLMEPYRLDEEGVGICPKCKTTFSSVKKKGVFGCSACYDTFSSLLDMTPFVGQGYSGERLEECREEKKSEEEGKDEAPAPQRILWDLKKELRKAVEEEHYEKAAKIRDQIHELEGK